MADEKQEALAEETPQGESEATETDWKAEARKWEARAKKSANAELELEALKQAQMTEQERLKAKADKAEAELAEMKAEQQRLSDAREIASQTAVPQALLEFCADREAMVAFAKAYAAEQQVTHAAASASNARIYRSNEPQPTNGQMFADAVAGLFK